VALAAQSLTTVFTLWEATAGVWCVPAFYGDPSTPSELLQPGCLLLRRDGEEMRDEVAAGAGFGLVFNLWGTRSIFSPLCVSI